MKAMIKMLSGVTLGILFGLTAFASHAQSTCDVTKINGGGFSTTIQSVVCNPGGTYTIILRVEHDGCPGPICNELSHYSVEADPGTYSNISVLVISGGMTYSNIDYGPNLGSDPFDGFKIDGTNGIGDGMPGSFTISYTLSGVLQAQQTSAKAGSNSQIAAFTVADFESVMNCNGTGCSGGLVGPTAYDDNAITPQNTPVDIPELTNDVPGTGALDPTSVTFIPGTAPNPATVGTFTVNGTTGIVTFTPVPAFVGTTTIDYRICDVNGLCDIATITVIIAPAGDCDSDGVPDAEDDYPCDPVRAFDNYFPATGNGTLAYEDLWPGKGDYDFNDLVADYRFKMVTNASNHLVEIYGTFTLRAFGASLHNGFGFQLPNTNIAQSHLDATGYQVSTGYISLGSNGLENGQTKPTFILWDDCYDLMPHPGSGIGVNTSPGAPYVTPVTVEVYIEFTAGSYTLAQLDISKFNPFLIVDLTRGHEVHLPDYTPTSLVDPVWFGQAQDNSIPSQNRYYKTEGNLPWAIHIYESFDYPKEMVEVMDAYNHFVEWVTSDGVSYPDWYQDKPGYRNNSNIY